MKRFIGLFLSFVLVATMIPTFSFAQNENIDPSKPLAAPTAEADEAKIGDKNYATLQDALDNAKDGDVVELLKDVTASGNYAGDGRYALGIKSKAITIDGKNHSIALTGGGRGIYLEGGATSGENKKVTFKDVTITNNQDEGRCIDTRGGYFDLVLDHATLNAKGAGNTQPLTIGGNHVGGYKNKVSVINNTAIDAGTAGYGVITFNPVDMTVENSKITGYATLYFKPANGSFGSKTSVINVNSSTLSTVNPHTVESDSSFASICVDDQNIKVNINDSVVNTETSNTAEQATVSFLDSAKGSVVTFNGNTRVNLKGEHALLVFDEKYLNERVIINSGSFNTTEALDYLAPNANVNIKLDKDVDHSIVIPKDTTVTLDLNGHNIKNTAGKHTITNSGNLTIVGEGVVDNTSHGRGALVNVKDSGAVANVRGGEFTRSKEAGVQGSNGGNSWYVISNDKGCTMNLENAKVHSTGGFSSLVRNYGTMKISGGELSNGFIAVKNEEESTLDITGGTIKSNTQAIQTYGTTTITDGDITGQVTICNYDKFKSTANVTGGTINGSVIVWDDNGATEKIDAIFDGATVNGDFVIWDHDRNPIKENDKLNIDIVSGAFDRNVSEYVVPNKGLIAVDGTYYVDDVDKVIEKALDAKNSVEVIEGVKDIIVPDGVKVTNKTGEEITVNGKVVSDDKPVIAETPVINAAPVINANDVTLTVGDSFDPLKGVTATDAEDGDLTKRIKVRSNVDTSKAGTYSVIYTVTDDDGATRTKTIKVVVKEKAAAPGEDTQVSKPQGNTPATGDATSMGLYAGLISLSALALMILAMWKKRKNS